MIRTASTDTERAAARRRVRPRALAAAELLGPLGRALRGAGYATLAPGWPDDPDTVEEAKANPQVFARKSVGQIAGRFV